MQLDASGTGFVSEWYETAAGRDGAKTVRLMAGQRSTFAAALPRGGVAGSSASTTAPGKVTAQSLTGGMSGRVTIEPGGVAAVGAYVTAIAPGASVNVSAVTDANGDYSLAGLSPGYSLVLADSWGLDGIRGYLGGAVSQALATYVTVGSTVLTGQDVHLQRFSTLSGTITDAGMPAANAQAILFGMGVRRDSVYTQADGSFQITHVPPGTYRLTARTATGRQIWWNGASDVDDAAEITVSADTNLTGYSMAVPAPALHVLSGLVRTAGGALLPNTGVAITNGSTTSKVVSDQGGVYSVHLAHGSYELGVISSRGAIDWSSGSVLPGLIAVTSDTVRDITVPDDRPITITVTGSDGFVPPSVSVYVYNSRNEFFRGVAGSNGLVNFTLPPGPFRLEVPMAGYRTWSSEIAGSSALSVPVTLDLGGKVIGSVGGPAVVTAINVVTGERISYLASNGTYTFEALPPGDYVLTAAPYDSSMTLCGPATWLGGVSYVTATRLHLIDGTSLTGEDFATTCQNPLSLGGDIYGLIALPSAVPAAAAAAVVVRVSNRVTWYDPVPVVHGAFELTVLTPGTYDITAYHSALGLEGHATVMVDRGGTSIVTVTMVRKGLVTGRILGPQGEPVPSMVTSGVNEALTDGQAFSLGGLPYGTHTLTVQPRSLP